MLLKHVLSTIIKSPYKSLVVAQHNFRDPFVTSTDEDTLNAKLHYYTV